MFFLVRFATVVIYYVSVCYKTLILCHNDRFKQSFFFFFLALLGLRCWARAFSSCGEQGLLLVAVHGLLIVVASLVAEHRL